MNVHVAAATFDLLGARWSYPASFFVLGTTVPVIVFLVVRYLWPVMAWPLANWVMRRRRNARAEETRRLVAIRKVLGTLAHDVLKHRLLGLVSLVQSLDVLEREELLTHDDDARQRKAGKTDVDVTRPEEWEGLRAELLRICGARAAPQDRLWARWHEAFAEVRRLAGGRVLPSWADTSFRRTDRTLMRLRRMVRAFVAGEREAALSPTQIRKLGLPDLSPIHGEVLRIAEGCRPELSAGAAVRHALSAVSALAGRRGASKRVLVSIDTDQRFLANAPSRLVAKGLERLLDNALRLSPADAPIAVRVELESDEFLGDELLVFRVLDTLESYPRAEQYSSGLRGLRDELAEFECGLSFCATHGEKLTDAFGESARQFAKEARIAVPVSPYESLRPGRHALLPIIIASVAVTCLGALAALATNRILGGAPIQFAGGGDPVVEFRVEVGDELTFELCDGGRAPRAVVQLDHDRCRPPRCSLAPVVARLQACSDGLADADCPNALTWTPTFQDGSRQGTSYELTVACHALGPPESEDMRRIRLVVSRPNSPPRFVLFQLTDNRTGTLLPLAPGRTAEIPAGGDLTLHALARDDDDDQLLFQLRVPDREEPFESYDGRFDVGGLNWRPNGTWKATLSVSDGVAPPLRQAIELKAGQLRPVRLERLVISNEDTDEKLSCVGPSDARLCEVVDEGAYLAELGVWFDPLLRRVDERIVLTSAEDSTVVVVPKRTPRRDGHSGEGLEVGQRWEVVGRYSGRDRTLATIDLVELPADSAPGERGYRFRIKVGTLAQSDPQYWTLKLSVLDVSGRAQPLDVVLVLARSESGKRPAIEVSRRLVKVSEYQDDNDRAAGRATVQVFLFDEDSVKELLPPTLVCGVPALADAFERPRIRQVGQGAWLLQIALKPGCIDGLGGAKSAYGSEELRTCQLELGTADKSERTVVRVRLDDMPCAPVVERLERTIDRPLANGETATWRLDIVDPDGDLDEYGVEVKGAGGFKVDLRRDPEVAGTHLYGTLSGTITCRDLRRPLSLEVRDRGGFVTRKQLPLEVRCDPLLRTEDGETQFVLDEGETLSVPLVMEDGVRAQVSSGPGEVVDGVFRWEASCERARGHTVEIQGRHAESTGDPLSLRVEVARCMPRLRLEEKGSPIDPDEEFVMEAFTVRRLRIVSVRTPPQDLQMAVHLDPHTEELSVATLTGQPDIFDLRCRREGEQTELIVEATPIASSEDTLLPAAPLTIPVVCVPKGEGESASPTP